MMGYAIGSFFGMMIDLNRLCIHYTRIGKSFISEDNPSLGS